MLRLVRAGRPRRRSADAGAETRSTEERPRLRLEVESGLSHHLLRLYRSGELDLLLVTAVGPTATAMHAGPEPLGWFGKRRAGR
ncbi:hypothetical protein ACPA9J_02025 [Pseudomonas aeruginosa]